MANTIKTIFYSFVSILFVGIQIISVNAYAICPDSVAGNGTAPIIVHYSGGTIKIDPLASIGEEIHKINIDMCHPTNFTAQDIRHIRGTHGTGSLLKVAAPVRPENEGAIRGLSMKIAEDLKSLVFIKTRDNNNGQLNSNSSIKFTVFYTKNERTASVKYEIPFVRIETINSCTMTPSSKMIHFGVHNSDQITGMSKDFTLSFKCDSTPAKVKLTMNQDGDITAKRNNILTNQAIANNAEGYELKIKAKNKSDADSEQLFNAGLYLQEDTNKIQPNFIYKEAFTAQFQKSSQETKDGLFKARLNIEALFE